MFFILSKTLGFFAIPSNVAIIVGLIGAGLLATRYARAGKMLAFVSLATLAVMGLSPLGNVLIVPLEQRFPPWDASRGAPDGIIVLGGAVSPGISAARGQPALNEAAERITAVAELARLYPEARIVFTGGNSSLIPGGLAEADFVLPLFESFGIPRERIILERRSRNTTENARLSKELARPKPGERWLLVTSAFHMPRAIGVFRQEDFATEAYPVDWRTRGFRDVPRPFATLSSGLVRTDVAIHEWAGLLAYWLAGRSSDLFPRP
jgi:uncharacterized SAM-binding protein YcdF (DUF218 family)